jgi:hypothetical protein
MTAPYAPTWLQPSAPGQLSNKRGSNTGADALSTKARYLNQRGSGDAVGSMLVSCSRIAIGGTNQVPQTAWNPGWVGTPAASALPAGLSNTTGSNVIAQYNNRVYFVATDGTIVSAPIAGGNVGTWRYELPLPSTVNLPGAVAVVNGRLYVLANNAPGPAASIILWTLINSDGTLGTWSATGNQTSLADLGSAMVGYGDSTTAWLIVLGGVTGAPSAFYFPISLTDGSVGNGQPTTALGVERLCPMAYYDSKNSVLYLIGGIASGAAVLTTTFAPVTKATGAIGAWSTGAPLPAARAGAGLAVSNGQVYVIGGSSSATPGAGWNGFQVATAYEITLGDGSGAASTLSNNAAAWNSSTSTLPVATAGLGAIATPLGHTWGGVIYPGVLVTVGGQQGATAVATVYQAGVLLASQWLSAWRNGASSGLVAGDLGTGGAIVTNQDGSQDLTFIYTAFSGAHHDRCHRRTLPRGRCPRC